MQAHASASSCCCCIHLLRHSRSPQVVQESALKFLAVAFNHTVWVLPKHLHLPPVPFTHLVALEAVLISALLLTQLAVPTKLLQPLGLDPIGNLQDDKMSRFIIQVTLVSMPCSAMRRPCKTGNANNAGSMPGGCCCLPPWVSGSHSCPCFCRAWPAPSKVRLLCGRCVGLSLTASADLLYRLDMPLL